MKRNLSELADKKFDIVIIGGGSFGACAAWDASLRGLSVALLERGDFCQATSANHFKIVHGGIRYLQHLDIKRVRESSKERNALLRIAPHLVKPLPIVVPTYGYGLKSKAVLSVGFKMYDAITFDRNDGIDDQSRMIPASSTISRSQTLKLFPELNADGLTGAGIFADGQMINPPRLVLSFVRSSVEMGATVANYVEAKKFLMRGDRVIGVEAQDRQTGETFEVRGKVVLNSAGPWAERLLDQHSNLKLHPVQTFSRDACFIVKKQLSGKYGLAVSGRTSDPDAILSREQRHLFIAPWRNYSLIGVWHVVYGGDPDQITVTPDNLSTFLGEINDAYPQLDLGLKDIIRWNAGLTLFGENKAGSVNLSYGKRSVLYDHARENNVEGLLTLIGVRATTARGMAEKAVSLSLAKMDKKAPASKTAETQLFGGKIDNFDSFVRQKRQSCSTMLETETVTALSRNYGSAISEVLKYNQTDDKLMQRIGSTATIKAEIVYAVHEEMAQHLTDVVYRRTDLASGAYPGDEAIRTCAEIMGKEMGWDPSRQASEVAAVKKVFQGVEV